MAWTVETMEAELWSAFGPYFTLVGLGVVDGGGARPALRAIIRDAVEAGGGTIADPPLVTDADIATMKIGHLGYKKVVALHALETIWGNWAKVDVKSGTTEQKLDQLAKRIQDKIKALTEELADPDSPTSILGIPIPAADIGEIIVGSYVPHDPYRWRYGDRFPY